MVELGQTQHVGSGIQATDEVQIARESLASLNPGDDGYLARLEGLARSLSSRFTRAGDLADLDEAITRSKQVLDLAPPGLSHLGALSNTGQVLLKRFKFRGDAGDITQAVGYFETAVDSCAPEQSFYVQLVANLCSGLLSRFRSYGNVADLDHIIAKSSLALSASSAESPHRDALFNNWATALKLRFEMLGNRSDLDTALAHYHACLDLRPPGHPLRHSVLGNLADALLFRFEVDGRQEDLETAANYFTSALQLRSPGQDGFLFYLMSLGIVHTRVYNEYGDIEKLEMAIGCYQTAMEYSPVPNLDHSRLLDNYASALRTRYTLSGNANDLDQAIQYLTESSDIIPLTYSGRPTTLFILATTLVDRFNAGSNVADLDAAIEKLASVLQSCGPGYHQRPVILSLYGHALSLRFRAKGDMRDLTLAASISKEALTLVSPTALEYASTVGNAAATLHNYFFYKSGNTEDIQFVIDQCDRALVSIPPSEATFINLKILRAQALSAKSLDGEDVASLDAAIEAFREIIAVLPEGHGEYVPVHLNLGTALEMRFQLGSDAHDQEEAIAALRVAQRTCKRGDTNYIQVCIHLGNVLRERFDNDFDPGGALDEAIVLLAEAEDILSATPEHIDYKASLVNLGLAVFMRFQAQRSREDLDTAIEHLSRALTLSGSVEEYLAQFSLATILSARYNERMDLDGLKQSVVLFGSAAEKIPPKHRFRGTLCRNYGHALIKLSEWHSDPLFLIDTAITFYEQSLKSFPSSHDEQPLTLSRIAEARYKRAELLSDEKGMHDAIKLVKDVIQTLSEDDTTFHDICHTAAILSMTTWKILESHPPSSMEDAFMYFEKAASYSYHRSFESIAVAFTWIFNAEAQGHSSALLAYRTCLDSLNHHLLSTASVKGRRAALLDKSWVKQTGTLATDATACAIGGGELELAVELSEQGRGLLWSQIAQNRTPLDALWSAGDVGRALASDFERVSSRLARIAVTHSETSLVTSRLTREEATQRYRQLSREMEDIVTRIRQQDGFQSFLDRPSFQNLRRTALGGPVILVNASRLRCDALIVLHDAPPRLVPLPNTTLEDLITLSENLYHMLKVTSHVGEGTIRERQLAGFLRTLWDIIVGPIVDELSKFLPRGARIWWCPTSKLTSLPLHAAGPYRKGALNLANMYVSSYTPTLAALIRARDRPSPRFARTPPAFVAISQAKPSSSTGPELQSVDAELTLVQSLVPLSMPFSVLSSDASTGDAALSALSTHGWAHLACHGRPNVEQPFDSSFALRDRAVTILDIIGERPVHDTGAGGDVNTNVPEFAFLSACHTAVGDRDAPDEIIHLAAAMQFAGFRSVIGTMWAVDDEMAREMVKAFYTHLFSILGGNASQGQEWDCTEAARALNRAAKSVNKEIVSIDQRIVFIHIGA